MATHGRKTQADEPLAINIAAGMTVIEAAEAAGVSQRTAHRRLNDPAFRRRVTELQAEMTSCVLGRLVAGMVEAADTLYQLLKPDGAANAGRVRLGAARAILEVGIKLREFVEFEARLAEVERMIDEPAVGSSATDSASERG